MQDTNFLSPSFQVWITCSDGSHEPRWRTMTVRYREYYTEERDGKLWLLSESEARRRAWDRIKQPQYQYPGGGLTQAWIRQQVIKQNTEQYGH